MKISTNNIVIPPITDEILFSTLPTQGGYIGLIILNRVAALNALSYPMIRALTQQLKNWRDDPTIFCVLITSASEKAFCAGGDIKSIYELDRAKHDIACDFFQEEYQLNYLIHTYPKPYIAILDGITMGGGVGISLHGTFRIATEHFVFAMPETAIGLFPDVGASFLLNECPGEIGTYLGLTGARLRASDAYYAGLIDLHIERASIPSLIEELQVSDLRHHHRKDVAAILERFHVPTCTSHLSEHRACIDEIFSGSDLNAIVDALTSHQDEFCIETLATIQKASPISLAVTLQHLRDCKNRDIAYVMQQDYTLACRFLENSDFMEGIRAAIIDKDRNPQWQPASIAALTQEKIDWYFSPSTRLL